jgi:ubiquinone/menaquinone biosynthesis C-methylase UbiE
MSVTFTAHNIRLDNGAFTRPESDVPMTDSPWLQAAQRVLRTVFPGDKTHYRLADLGCLEGGFAVEFARMGFRVLGIEIRESNLAACWHVKAHTNLPNLEFVRDDAWNVAAHGTFDAVFCCGLLYHLDRPKRFLELLSRVTTKLLIVQTHFATETPNAKFSLSAPAENESLPGCWFPEFVDDAHFRNREEHRWSAWDNRRSFWIRREYLLQTLRDVGFDLVAEQFDGLGPDIAGSMLHGYYRSDDRGTFIGVKCDG